MMIWVSIDIREMASVGGSMASCNSCDICGAICVTLTFLCGFLLPWLNIIIGSAENIK